VTALDLTGVLRSGDPEVPRGLVTESGLRTRSAGELKEALIPHMADYGITRVAHLTGFDFLGLPVHMAMKPQGLSLSSGSGKGTTPEASWVSAFMECSEQAVWENLELETIEATEHMLERMNLTFVRGDELAQLKGAIWNDRVIVPWVPGWDIVAGEEVLVPSPLVDVIAPSHTVTRPFVSGSNGLASGAHVLEATLSGLQEVIERDGMTLNTLVTRRPRLNADALLAEQAPEVFERIERSGMSVRVLDATCDDVGVPIVVAYLYDVPGGRTGVFKGAGAGTSARTAMVRAVTEAAQARCLIVAGARDDQFESQRRAAQRSTSFPSAENSDVYTGGLDAGTGSVVGDLAWLVDRVVAAGFPRVIVIRHTEPDEPVQVVRVIVPGLEGYPFGYAQTGPRAAAWAKRHGEVA
jgi:ribosomal protein S12 methylthiotransferase accessory factor